MAFGNAAAARRPIEGAVATLGVSDRVAFLRRTYALLGASLIAFAMMTGGLLRFATNFSLKFSMWAFSGYTWIFVLILFMVVGVVAQKLAQSQTSRGLQLFGLGLAVFAESLLLQPMLWILMIRFGNSHGAFITEGDSATLMMNGQAASILMQAIVITLSIFVGLTAVVFVTKKDFSFMRGVLSICTFGVLGVIFASLIFGFSLGAVFSGFVILLMAGYILYQTSIVMNSFPPSAYVAAALMLFSTVATLFWYVLRILMELNRR